MIITNANFIIPTTLNQIVCTTYVIRISHLMKPMENPRIPSHDCFLGRVVAGSREHRNMGKWWPFAHRWNYYAELVWWTILRFDRSTSVYVITDIEQITWLQTLLTQSLYKLLRMLIQLVLLMRPDWPVPDDQRSTAWTRMSPIRERPISVDPFLHSYTVRRPQTTFEVSVHLLLSGQYGKTSIRLTHVKCRTESTFCRFAWCSNSQNMGSRNGTRNTLNSSALLQMNNAHRDSLEWMSTPNRQHQT